MHQPTEVSKPPRATHKLLQVAAFLNQNPFFGFCSILGKLKLIEENGIKCFKIVGYVILEDYAHGMNDRLDVISLVVIFFAIMRQTCQHCDILMAFSRDIFTNKCRAINSDGDAPLRGLSDRLMDSSSFLDLLYSVTRDEG